MYTDEIKIAVIGLGYVGLPLAIEFGKSYPVVGFDISKKRIQELQKGIDRTNEIDKSEFEQSSNLVFTSEICDIEKSNVFIVTVPTPIDKFNTPDLRPLLQASRFISSVLKKGDVVIYESTVYPGCTEDECVPVLEEGSGLIYNIDFFCGYSPERINPGDKVKTLTTIVKVTSGSTAEIADFVGDLYSSIISAGVYRAPSIKVAEASKAIENAQRDVNISFVNELSMIFDKLGIDTNEVLEAAGTKWNFLKFKPGLVGGHCIGVDPYYLVYKAESLGYKPQVIASGRRINDHMGVFVANKCIKLMINKRIQLASARALIMGFTFKENCSDIRNSKVIDIYKELNEFCVNVDIYDPIADSKEVFEEYGVLCNDVLSAVRYDLVVVAVGHDSFFSIDYGAIVKENSVIFDLKGILDKNRADARL